MTSHPPLPIGHLPNPFFKYPFFPECKSSLLFPSNSLISLFSSKALHSSSMKKFNLILRKCKSLSRQLGRSSSYSSLRSKSAREDHVRDHMGCDKDGEHCETIYVGSTRKRYVISSKYLNHPLLNALIERSKQKHGGSEDISVKCEVVLFDHLLWMLENSDPNLILGSLEELADLYVF